MIDSAYQYIQEGFSAIPLRENKAPMLPENPYLYKLMDENDIDRMFMQAKKIGIACGVVSDGFECIDFDSHKGEPIRQIFNDFMKDDGVSTIVDVHNLPIFKTPAGGYHIYYKCSKSDGSRKLANWPDGGTMIETRGHGSYVATFPSEGYVQLKGTEIIKVAEISEDERDYFLQKCESFTQYTKTTQSEQGSGSWPTKFDTKTAWGKFNEDGVDEAKQLLEDKGWACTRIRQKDKVEMWIRPDKEYGNGVPPVSATFGQLHNMFYVFTTSAPPFEGLKGYTPFDILMMLKYDGDKKKAINYLEEKYDIQHYKPVVTKKTIDFPINVFPELIVNYINEQNAISNFDKNLMSATFVWLISTMIGNRFKTKVNDTWNVSPVIWLMIIAERGSTKTHAINAVIQSAKKLDSITRKEFEKEMKEYNPEDKTQKKPYWKQLFLEDGTREGYLKAMSHNPKGLGLMKDELTGWVSDMDRHNSSKGGDEAFWLSSFNNSSYTKNIKGDDGTHVERVFINLAGSIQPEVLNDMVKNHSVNGLFDRFLLVPYTETPFVFSMKKPELSYFEKYNDFVKLFNEIMNSFNEDYSVEFTEDAEIEFERCYNNFLQIKYKEQNGSVGAYIAKIITYLPRITLVIELMDQVYDYFMGNTDTINSEISPNSVKKAFDILHYFLNNARNVLFDLDTKLSMSDIIRSCGAIKKNDKVRALLSARESKEIDVSNVEIANFVGTTKPNVSFLSKKNTK